MHITLTRQEAEQLLSEIELNYQNKAAPLIEEAKKLELEAKNDACKEWDEFMGILKSKRYRGYDRQSYLLYEVHSPYEDPPHLDGFFRSNAYYRLKNALSSGLGFEIKVDSKDMLFLAEDRDREYKLNGFGNIQYFKGSIETIQDFKKKALDKYRTGTGKDFYQPDRPQPMPAKPKSFFERLFGG
ncbi:hypothetical protein CASP1_00036 [Alcaligenes phage CASP1]|nr:hypothetical protein CASP1_00036 [Alcaligenes phage CASP1]